MMNMEVNGTKIQVKLYDNSSAEAVKELLTKRPFTIHYEGLCQYGKIRQLWNAVSDK